MTKLKPPLTVEAALARIQGQLDRGVADMAKATGRSESMIRAYAEPARREGIPIEDSIVLDLAYRAAGGTGAPLHEFYSLQLELQAAAIFADQQALGKTLPSVIKEVGEAEIAIFHASQPGATRRDVIEGVREVEEAISSLREPLAIMRKQLSDVTGGADMIPP